MLHKGSGVATFLGTLLGVRDIKRSNLQDEISRPRQLSLSKVTSERYLNT